MAKKYRITNCNATKVNIAIIGSSNYRTVAPGAELYLGELSDEKAAAYKKAYNCIGCVLSVIPENPVNKCIEERMPKKKGCCDTPTTTSTTTTSTTSTRSAPAADGLIDVGEKINNQIVQDLEQERQEVQAQSTPTSAENTQVESTTEQTETEEGHKESVVEAHSETEEGSKDLTEEELNELTKAELKEMAESMGLEVDGRSSKAKIISMILENQ